jgi:hypothetical protein
LIKLKGTAGAVWQSEFMKISETICPSCQTLYEVAEAISVKGQPGRQHCSVCGDLIASWQEPKLRAYRLVLPPRHRDFGIPTQLSPVA